MMSLVRAIPTEPKLIAGASHRTEKSSGQTVLLHTICMEPREKWSGGHQPDRVLRLCIGVTVFVEY